MKKHKYRYTSNHYRGLIRKELKKNALKYLRFNTLLNKKLRQKSYMLLVINFGFLNLNKLKIFCLLTGRTRYVLKKFKISRLAFKKVINLGYNCGYYKKSW